MNKLSVFECGVGDCVEIVEVDEVEMRNRFLQFGFVCGSKFVIVGKSRSSVVIKRGGVEIAIDVCSAKNIFVKKCG